MRISRKILALLVVAGTFGLVYAAEVTLWGNIAPSERYDIVVIDDFEERIPWNAPSDLPAGSLIRMVKNSPADGLDGEYPRSDYEKDIELANASARLRSRRVVGGVKHSQEIQVMIQSPGYDQLILRPPEFRSQPISGMPLAVSLWVYGYGKRHVLYALLKNPGGKEMALRLGELKFRGWQRLEIPLKPWMQKKKPFDPWQFSFTGLKFVSHPSEDPGLYLLRIDLLQVLVDHGAEYPGSQIKDEF